MPWTADFAPKGWHFCNGALLPINQYEALFSLLGVQYGGNGQTTFGLPNLNGRVAVGAYQGGVPTGTTHFNPGVMAGTETRTLIQSQMPQHTHAASTSSSGAYYQGMHVQFPAVASFDGMSEAPGADKMFAKAVDSSGAEIHMYATGAVDTYLKEAVVVGGDVVGELSTTLGVAGQGIPFSLLNPCQAVNYIICVQGYYPSRW